ncbi:PIN domain-containing protein [Microcoleus sp. SVA1_B6]|uniref:PIN-like domain-containing protein n=1 Tax=unclassified Microcoleus TaxID=2642155 RepID=UPI002FD3D7BF
MRNLFFWRLPPSEADFSRLWEDATFVFDTNFLLDLYRVSHSTAENFLNILQQIKNRIWLPYQVADEFLRRREEIIASEVESFQKALSVIEKWKSEQQNFNSLRGSLRQTGRIVSAEVDFLFGDQKHYLDAVDAVEKAFREKIEQITSDHSSLHSEKDSILENLLLLFDSKVGEPFNEQMLPILYKEADDRYKREKPPGFMDAKEKEDERKYGDFILWKQILEFAKKESQPIIFVTGEKKEDWWLKKNNKIISPHIELRREFNEYVHQPFWMYQTQDFLQIAKDKLMVEIDPKSIEETNAIADIELVDEQDNDTLRQAVDQIVKPNSVQQYIEQIKAVDQIVKLNYVQQLSEQIKAVDQIVKPNSVQQYIEQIKAVDYIVKPSALQQYIEQIKAVDYIVKPNSVQQLIEQIKVPSSALHQAQERMKVLQDNSTFQLNPHIQKLISETITTSSPENGKLQEIDTPASNNEQTTSPILDRPQEEAEESKSQSKSKRRSPSKKRNESNLKNSNK